MRHGKTQWNLERRLQGQFGDSALLPESYAEIAKVRDFLSAVSFDKVFVSPKKRAIDTALHLTDLPLHPDMRLAEWNFGLVEGMKIDDAIAKYPHEMWASRYQLADFDGSAFGAESVAAVLARFDSLYEDSQAFDTVLWVGHGATGTAGMRHLAGFPIDELRAAGGLDNNTVTILENGKLIEWNRKP